MLPVDGSWREQANCMQSLGHLLTSFKLYASKCTGDNRLGLKSIQSATCQLSGGTWQALHDKATMCDL